MAAGTFTMFTKNLNIINTAALAANTVTCALVSSSYTPDYTSGGDSLWADASSDEISGVNGYTTGGQALVSSASTAITGGYKFTSQNLVWTATGGSIAAWRRAVFYYDGTLGGLTNPLIGAFLGDATPADIPATAAGKPLEIDCPTDGWFTVTD